MTEIPVIPRIRCDNCGLETDKVMRTGWEKPYEWLSDAYGFDDLCGRCGRAAEDAAEAALAKVKSEGFDGPTGAE